MLKFIKPLSKSRIGSGVVPGMVAIALAALLWAIGATVASDLFQAGMAPFELAMSRAVISAVGLALMNQMWPQKRRWSWMDWRVLALGLSLAFVTLAYYVAIDRLAVAVAIVIQYTAPVLVVLWMMLKYQRIPSPSVVMALIAAIFGVFLISGLASQRVELDALGLFSAGMSALFFASYTLLNESAVTRYEPMDVTFRGFTASALFWLTFQVSQGIPAATFDPHNLFKVLFVGIGGTLMPFTLYCWGIQRVQAERAAIAATLEPVLAAGLAWSWLGQTLTVVQLLGGLLVLAAVVTLQTSGFDPHPNPES